MNNVSDFDVNAIAQDSLTDYVLEVDLEFGAFARRIRR